MDSAANRFSSINFLAAGLVTWLFLNSCIFSIVVSVARSESVTPVLLSLLRELCSTWPIISLLTMTSPDTFNISLRVPFMGEATSITTLSVSISTSSSSIFTMSPTFLYQVDIVPSGTDSGKAGALISIAIFNPSKFL